MGIQNSINSLLGTAATIAEVANISKGVKAGNALNAEEAASNLQGKELDLYGAIARDEEGVKYSKRELSEALQMTPKQRQKIGFDIPTRAKALQALQGQLAGKKLQLADIRARMKQMNVQSLLSKGDNE